MVPRGSKVVKALDSSYPVVTGMGYALERAVTLGEAVLCDRGTSRERHSCKTPQPKAKHFLARSTEGARSGNFSMGL